MKREVKFNVSGWGLVETIVLIYIAHYLGKIVFILDQIQKAMP